MMRMLIRSYPCWVIPITLLAWASCLSGELLETALDSNVTTGQEFFMATRVIGKVKYTIVMKDVDFTVAVQECSKIGGSPADVKDRAENDKLVEFIKASIPSYKYGLWVSGLPVGVLDRPAWLYTALGNRLGIVH